jgi:hypothetical protein
MIESREKQMPSNFNILKSSAIFVIKSKKKEKNKCQAILTEN